MNQNYVDMSVESTDVFPTLDFLCPNSNNAFQPFSTISFLGPSSSSFHLTGSLLDDGFQPSCSFTSMPKRHHGPTTHGRYVAAQYPYPSPPSTGSESKRTLDLPIDSCHPTCTSDSHDAFGGILDSPLVHKHQPLRSQAPPSPPPTIPTATQELPPADGDFPCSLDDLDMDDSQSDMTSPSMSISSCSSSPLPQSPLSSCGLGDGHHLLSPLSPEWGPSYIKDMPIPQTSKDFVLLSDDHQVPFSVYRPSLSPPSTADFHSHHLLDVNASPYAAPSTGFSFFNCSPWNSDHCTSQQDVEYKHTTFDDGALSPMSAFSPQLPTHDHELNDDRSEPLVDFSLQGLYSPPGSYQAITVPSSPAVRSHSLPEDPDDHFYSPPIPPASPRHKPLSLQPDDELIAGDFPPSSAEPDSTYAPDGNGKTLLFEIEADPDDVLPPRSPLPEQFVLDPKVIASIPDADLHRLNALRLKLEQRLNPSGFSSMANAEFGLKKTRKDKTDKEVSAQLKEVLALIRLKLGELGIVVDEGQTTERQRRSSSLIDSLPEPMLPMEEKSITQSRSFSLPSTSTSTSSPLPPPENILTKSPKPPKPPKKKIATMDQLVARMVFRRHRGSRGGRMAVLNHKSKHHRSSPLTQSSSSSMEGEDDEEPMLDGIDAWRPDMESPRLGSMQSIGGSRIGHQHPHSSVLDDLELELGVGGFDYEPMGYASSSESETTTSSVSSDSNSSMTDGWGF